MEEDTHLYIGHFPERTQILHRGPIVIEKSTGIICLFNEDNYITTIAVPYPIVDIRVVCQRSDLQIKE